MLDLDRPVTDRLLLRTVPGAVDYLVEELRAVDGVTVASRRPDGVVVDVDAPLRHLAAVRYFTSAAIVLGDDVVAGLRASAVATGLGESVRFRVGDLGERRWSVRDALVADGWVNDPGDWQLNLETDAGPVAEVGELYWSRRFGKLLRAPASTNPVIATVMVRLAKLEPGQVLLDPVCGAGTLLATAAAMAPGARLLGGDHDRRWVAAAATNAPTAGLWRGDARRLPVADGSVQRLVANLPFGKRVGSHIGNKTLYPALLAEIARVLPPKGRAVLLTEDKRLFVQTVQRTRGVRVVKEIGFTTGGAHPSAYVVTTRRTRLFVADTVRGQPMSWIASTFRGMNTTTDSPTLAQYNTVNGFIIAKGAAKLIAFLTEVFDGTEVPEAHTPDFYAGDGSLIHAEVRIGNSVIMVADRKPDWPFTPALTQVYVTDAAQTLRRAVDRGASVVTEVSPFYGDLDIARFVDPWGNLWWLFAPATTDDTADESAADWDAQPGPVYTTLLDAMRRLTDPA